MAKKSFPLRMDDEMFELLTLQQTGKADPTPIVLLDRPGGTFWAGLVRFATEQLIPTGVISPDGS